MSRNQVTPIVNTNENAAVTKSAAFLPPSPATAPEVSKSFEAEEDLLAGANDPQEPERNLDNYIPFRIVDLRDSIIEDFPEAFPTNDTKVKFFSFIKWIQIRNAVKIDLMFQEMKDIYSYLDPDGGTENPGAGRLSENQKEGYFHSFVREFKDVMEIGDFDKISQEFIDEAYAEQPDTSAGFMGTGLEVKQTDTDKIEYHSWYRGKEREEVKYRTWRTWFRQHTQVFYNFDRLVIMYRKRPKDEIAELERLSNRSWWTKAVDASYDFMLKQGKQSMSQTDDLLPGLLYLKLFKSVSNTDIDMLMPGAEGKFSWLDYLVIWGSLIFAVGMSIYKAVTGSLKFDTMFDILTALVLIVMPLYGAYNGYMSIQKKIQDLQSHLNALYIVHNLSSNSAVLYSVLDEALEQEDKETLLAYFFLWRGLKSPKPMSKKHLDKSIEEYLGKLLKRYNIDQVIDFEVTDALEKLRRMSILDGGDDEDRIFQVLPLDQAVEKAHIRQFDEAREVEGVKRIKRAPGALVWRECVDTYPATGQKFRYFFNMDTGESSFKVPEFFIPLLDQALVVTPAPPSTVAALTAAGLGPSSQFNTMVETAETPKPHLAAPPSNTSLDPGGLRSNEAGEAVNNNNASSSIPQTQQKLPPLSSPPTGVVTPLPGTSLPMLASSRPKLPPVQWTPTESAEPVREGGGGMTS
ncbi:hypothetical protein CEUSTIGMA_g5112.t1 [Chlamydomonas eustigma]|uniref:Uncharacterized protein n=1 Tax=Chlamydomonas eustigma TaxID=1157962 RepID=A0A250X421_9CHLO|nr:hypothetical protein CEUSTIGMA_g5112.t1 [Chlamydomonas eustigma]|eukprot:GAX77669.1 hypothetical protein CEUSTIGMA_g5112.t1 [Chlamydomonas eustigma]